MVKNQTYVNMKVLFLLITITYILKSVFCKDPDDNIPTCQLVASKGYPCQEFNVTTADGYILTMHRIANGINSPGNAQNTGKPVVFLQHGLLDSSATWVMNFPNQSLGFLLADAGYDVWMGNVRGNKYSRAHNTLSVNSNEFWHFTFDEMAKYDIPAMIEYALSSTSRQHVYYVGHSQGTLVGFIQFSEDPTWAQAKIKQFHALAPIAYLGHSTSALQLVAPLANEVGLLLGLLGYKEFLPNSQVSNWFAGNACAPPSEFICSNILWILAGYDYANMNQLMKSKKFQKMDWGYFENKKYYGQFIPPQYNAAAMTVPTALYYGDTDIFADPTDVQYLQSLLQNVLYSHEYPIMDHMDFVWGMNAPAEIYPTLIQLINADVQSTK